jgi:hypothetical protein
VSIENIILSIEAMKIDFHWEPQKLEMGIMQHLQDSALKISKIVSDRKQI